MKYRILDIRHSGRENVRNKQVEDRLEDHTIGSIIELISEYDIHDQEERKIERLEDIQQFSNVKWKYLSPQCWYDWWKTSPLLGLRKRFDGVYELETVNSIYHLMELN